MHARHNTTTYADAIMIWYQTMDVSSMARRMCNRYDLATGAVINRFNVTVPDGVQYLAYYGFLPFKKLTTGADTWLTK